MKYLTEKLYCFKITTRKLSSLEELLLEKYEDEPNKVKKMLEHYRAFLIGIYSKRTILPSQEISEIQALHRKTEDYKEFIEEMGFEVDLDSIIVRYGHADIKSKQKLTKNTIKFLDGFNLKLSNNRNTALKPIDAHYTQMPTILY